jgi:hypothetical protein
MSKPFHIGCDGATQIGMPTTSVDVIDHGNMVDDCGIADIRNVIMTDIYAGNTITRTEVPVIVWRAIGTE